MFTLCDVCCHGFWWVGLVHHSRTMENSSITIKISFCLPFKPPFPVSLSSENHWSVFHSCSFTFFWCSQIIYSFLDLTFLLSQMYFRAIYVVELIAFYYWRVSYCIDVTACLCIHQLKDILIASSSGQLWIKLQRTSHTGFYVNTSFYFTWINT